MKADRLTADELTVKGSEGITVEAEYVYIMDILEGLESLACGLGCFYRRQ